MFDWRSWDICSTAHSSNASRLILGRGISRGLQCKLGFAISATAGLDLPELDFGKTGARLDNGGPLRHEMGVVDPLELVDGRLQFPVRPNSSAAMSRL